MIEEIRFTESELRFIKDNNEGTYLDPTSWHRRDNAMTKVLLVVEQLGNLLGGRNEWPRYRGWKRRDLARRIRELS